MNHELFFRITESKEIANRKKMAALFGSLPPGSYLLTVKPSKQRSLPQNAYFHSIVLDMVFHGLREVGWDWIKDKEDAKEFLKNMFLKRKYTNENTGEEMEIVLHTHKLTTTEFSEFIAEIQRWASEYLSVVIPDPGQRLEIDFTP